MNNSTPQGRTILDLLLAGGLLLGLTLALQVVFNDNDARLRDLQRVTMMRQAEQMFQKLYRETGSYAAAASHGCSEEGVLFSSCNFALIGLSARDFRDPGDGMFVMTAVPTTETFSIEFRLEGPHRELAAGVHTVTPLGIQ